MKALTNFKTSFDPHLEALIDQKFQETNVLVDDQGIHHAIAYAKQLLFSGGKRIRPYLVSLAFRGRATNDAGARQAGIALELFHLFALIHDDIMDQGKSRHGIPTAHLKITEILAEEHRSGDLTRTGESQAILLGDLLLSWANQLMATDHPEITDANLRAARDYFFRMNDEVMIGQMIDVDLMTQDTTTLELIDRKMRLKTASYTFIRPLHIGAALSGAPQEDFTAYEQIGEALGLAFQIQDDLFDLASTPKEIKKTVFSDLSDRQHTVFTHHLMAHGTSEEKQELSRLFGQPLTEEDRPRVMRLFTESGAIEAGKKRMEEHFNNARAFLSNSSLPSHTQQELSEFIDSIQNRPL